ncbi:hypothetical protein [Pseudomonas huaxiensis]|uniref:hypothetical protein n=1 Tax=Pseudomonas huaxiensis TaxID=2213017 RepID=UPI000DA6B4AA|nr:hypothetical protein [Pseudomonas huaxiensis]
MNAAIQLHRNQFDYDNREPVPLEDCEAERIWIENATIDLLRGADVRFQRAGRQVHGVTYEQFATAVDERLSALLIETVESGSANGRMYLAARRGAINECKSIVAEVLSSDQVLRDIAAELLAPLAGDGVIADAEDD